MNIMRRSKRVLAILLSMALMLSMVMPIAFADDTAQTNEAETVQEDSGEATVAAEASQDGITVEEISLDEDEIEQSRAKLAASNINRRILISGLDNHGHSDIMIILCFFLLNIFSPYNETKGTALCFYQ